ncbi:MAG: phosphoribosylanthranilate isomerase [Cardiobacteriaceae bacterium]|nr:phosphoribosylanthranilate isomerase [Cardiobacteriaceae bacterium]
MTVKIKICGITELAEIDAAVKSGADALGFVFYEKSKRAVNIEQARQLIAAVAPFVQTVGLFVNHSAEFVRQVIDKTALDLLQFHGAEEADFCRQFGRKWIKSVPMRNFATKEDASNFCRKYPDAAGFLFDACGGKIAGGSGEVFDWEKIPAIEQPVILAGGLTAENVQRAISEVRPFAVDVSSGVEAENHKKCLAKIADFIDKARAV